ncbi:MAG: trigger factor [Candidatus Omnitrophica bacterium]|nr:trigger factor [Candidatus Omnitrophota bacterium]
MKTELKKLDNNKRQINIELPAETVKNKFEEVFKKIGEKAKVPGFRPGHVPKDILEKHFTPEANQQVLNELIPDAYNQAVEKEKLEVLEVPKILDVKLERASLSFKAEVEVMPEITVKNYKGLKINFQKAAVTADEVKRHIDSFKESRKIDTLDEKLARTLGYPDVAELEKAVERQLFMQKENQERQKIENQVLDQLNKGLDFPLPNPLVEKQLQDLLRRAKIELAMKGFPKDKIEEQEKTMIAELEPEAKKQVKTYLILSTIAKKENITQDDHMPAHVMEFLFKEGDWNIT